MEYIVCNKCGGPPGKSQFHITACSHVCCDSCLSPAPERCPLCEIPTKTLKIDANLPKNVKKMFGDPAELMMELQKRMCKITTFQKSQKTHLTKIDKKKASMRKDQMSKMEKKKEEVTGQMEKLAKMEESSKKKLEEAESENEKLEKAIAQLQLDLAAAPSQELENEDDFFMRNTPTSSSPSVTSSNHEDDEMFQFDLLGLRNRSDSLDQNSASSNCSSQSTQPGDQLF